MSKVISISSDRNLFKEGSAVRERQIEYAGHFGELHVIVFTKGTFPAKTQIAPNAWVYATNSFSKLTYVSRAVKIAGAIIRERRMTKENAVITVQDPFESSLVGTKIKRDFGLPLHIQIHTDFLSPYFSEESGLNKIRVRIARKSLPQADAVRVVSQRIADSLRAIQLKPGLVPAVLPIFVDTTKFEHAQFSSGLREKYSQFNFIILMASRLTKEKNIPFALEVFKTITAMYSHVGLIIVGEGPEKANLVRLHRTLNLNNNVYFENWNSDLATYYKTVNLFLLTSHYEGYGLTLVESVAAHCPVVSTDVGIANTLLKDGITLVCPVGDHNCFVEKISKLIEDPGLRLNFAQEAASRLDKVAMSDKNAYLQAYKAHIESVFSK